MSSNTGITEDAVGGRYAAGGTAFTMSLDHIQGVGAPAVSLGAGDVVAVGRAQSPVCGRDDVDCRPEPAA